MDATQIILATRIATILVMGGLQYVEHLEILASFQFGLEYSPKTEGTQFPLLSLTKVLHLLAKLQEVDFGLTLQVGGVKGKQLT